MMIFKEVKADAQGHMGDPQEVGRMGINAEGRLWVRGEPSIVQIAMNPLKLTFGGEVDPSTDAQKFLESLPDRYHGTYFWVEEAPDETPPSHPSVN